jgi:serine/threonine protein kinase/tetratricopeptide (TPR) repeat protein
MRPALAGKPFGPYELVRALGSGGMGAVFEARHRKLGRRVAIKLLHANVAAPGADNAFERFVREGRAAARVQHPNVVDVYDFGVEDGVPFLVMELVEGETLARRIERLGRLSLTEVVSILLPVISAVAEIHAAHIVHRDLKPANILLATDRAGEPCPKVADFGVSRLDDGTPGLTESGVVVGTYAYMAPELGGSSRRATERTDQYALGVILHECTTGVTPFRGNDPFELLQAIMSAPVPPPSAANPALPKDFDAVVLRAMSRDPADRFACVEELGEALLAFADGDSSARWVSEFRPSTRTVPPPRGATRAAKEEARPDRTSSWRAGRSFAVLGFCSVLVLLATAGVWKGAEKPVDAGPAPSPVARHGTALLELPAPRSTSAEALAAYSEGLHALHDGSWARARDGFARAVAADPAMAAAHMRLATMSSGELGTATQTRVEFQLAEQLRAVMSERDQAFLDALAPTMQWTPEQPTEGARRFHAALQRFPDDAEMLVWMGYDRGTEPAAALPAFERATEVDPRFGDALEGRGRNLAWLGRVDEARSVFEQCVSIPTELDCLYWLRLLDAADGACEACERDARRRIDRDPLRDEGYHRLADALLALGRPVEGVNAALTQARSHQVEPARRARDDLADRADVAVVEGDFAHAAALARQELALVNSEAEESMHFRPTRTLVNVALETGDAQGAGRIAADYLKRMSAWTGIEGVYDKDNVPWLWHVAARGGAVPVADFSEARQRWLRGWSGGGRLVHGLDWVIAFAGSVDTAEEATTALAELERLGPVPPFFLQLENNELHVGRVYLLGGRAAESIPHLERAAKHCARLGDAFAHPHAELALGTAREAIGDAPGACEAYRAVTAQWSNARPRSMSAARAQERLRALACAR